MPDQHPKTRNLIWPLSYAANQNMLVWVEYGYCRGRRYYRPNDLIHLFGDVDVNRLTRRMTCERCGRSDNIEADVYLPVAAERANIVIRRLVDVRIKRLPVWSDEKS